MVSVEPVRDDLSRMVVLGWAGLAGSGLTEAGKALLAECPICDEEFADER